MKSFDCTVRFMHHLAEAEEAWYRSEVLAAVDTAAHSSEDVSVSGAVAEDESVVEEEEQGRVENAPDEYLYSPLEEEPATTTADLELQQDEDDGAADAELNSEASPLPLAQVWEMDNSRGTRGKVEHAKVEPIVSAGSEESAMRVELATLVETANELEARRKVKASERRAKVTECNVLTAKVESTRWKVVLCYF